MIKKIFLTFLFFAVSACGPQFSTEYILTPPKSQSGQNCLFQCETIKQQCFQIEDSEYYRCEDRSRQENYDCEYNIRITKNREPKWYECGGETCSRDNERCENSYRSCYQSCGGKVETVTRCVSNCEQLAPPPPSQKKK